MRRRIVIPVYIISSLLTLSACQNTLVRDSFSYGSNSEPINNSSEVISSTHYSSDSKKYTLKLYIESDFFELNFVDGFITLPNLNKEHKRFAGWSMNKDSLEIVFTYNERINFDDIKEFFGDKNAIELYAVYANVIDLTLAMDNEKSFKLDSILANVACDFNVEKNGYRFLGWGVEKDSIEIKIPANLELNYVNCLSFISQNYSLVLYPIYEKVNKNIELYNYSKSTKMAEIHINTQNGIAIDDKSLINPNEHKGKNGELPAYNYVPATIDVNSVGEGNDLTGVSAQVKVRGNYTSSYKKKPIRIKFEKRQKMLGLANNNKLKSWVLLAEWKDSSLLRNALANFIGNGLLNADDLYCSDFRFVKVYLNDAYNGVYLLAEQQQLDQYRINLPESNFETDGVNYGYMLELDGYYTNEPKIQTFTVDYGTTALTNGFTIVNDIMNQKQHDFIAKCTQSIWNVISDAINNNHANPALNPFHTIDSDGNYVTDYSIKNSEEAVGKVINLDSLVNMYILHEICEDRDIGWSSFYFTLDMSDSGDHKLTFNAPWDFDYALGNNTFGKSLKASLSNQEELKRNGILTGNRNYKFSEKAELNESYFRFSNTEDLYAATTDNPWFILFNNCEWFYSLVKEKWNKAIDANLFKKASEMLDFYADSYSSEYLENFTYWKESMGLKIDMYQPSIVSYFVNEKQAEQYLKIWFETRIKGLNAAFKKM